MTNIILSYPRSGNHFVRFLIEFATGKPTKGCLDSIVDHYICRNVFPQHPKILAHVKGDPEYIKYHFVWKIEEHIQKRMINQLNKVIFILRNPVEAIARHNNYTSDEQIIIKEAKLFADNILFFKKHPDPKHQVIYENLIHPDKKKQEVKSLLEFVEADKKLTEKLINNLEEYSQISKQGKNRAWNGSVSQDNPNFHSERIHDLQRFQEIIHNYTNTNLTR